MDFEKMSKEEIIDLYKNVISENDNLLKTNEALNHKIEQNKDQIDNLNNKIKDLKTANYDLILQIPQTVPDVTENKDNIEPLFSLNEIENKLSQQYK